jgi:uncharacterized protein YdaU (DUF1376 family)
MNYYEHHIGDYAAATAHLSLTEDAVYSRMLRRYYLTEAPLPVEKGAVARLVGARTPEEVAAVDVVLAEFFRLADDGWHQKRCDEDIAKFRDKQGKARASAEARWNVKPGCERNANASETHSERKAHQSPDTNHQQEQKQELSTASPFERWWTVYPKKSARKAVEARWNRRGLDSIADQLIADVLNRKANDDKWLQGFAPEPMTYINQDRWNDDVRSAPAARAGPAAPASKTLSAMQTLQGIKHGLAGNRTTERADEVALIGSGSDPGE